MYKIVYPEDVLPPLPPAKRTALSGDTSDEDSYGECESPPQIPAEMVISEMIIFTSDPRQPNETVQTDWGGSLKLSHFCPIKIN